MIPRYAQRPWFLTALLISVLASTITSAQQQSIEYITPQEAWRVPYLPMQRGNGVYMEPNGEILVAVSYYADVSAMNPLTGDLVWDYTPNLASGAILTTSSGITFNSLANPPYLVFAVTGNLNDVLTW
jgi:hypothetical protein